MGRNAVSVAGLGAGQRHGGGALDLTGSRAHPEPLLVSMAITQGMSADPQNSESGLPSGSRALRCYLPHICHLCLLSVLRPLGFESASQWVRQCLCTSFPNETVLAGITL